MYYSYVPKYDELDYLYEKYMKHDPNKKLNFFFDVKNGIYNRDDNLNESNKLEHSVEFISAVTNVIQYIKNRYEGYVKSDRLKFYFFCETGKSSYHRAIDMGYKANRGLNDYLARDTNSEMFSQIVFFSINVLKDLINMIPNAYFFLGEFMEFDYIPYVIYKKCFTKDDIGVVFSTDKDMYQLSSYTDQFEQLEKIPFKTKWHPGRLFINKDNYANRICYKDIQNLEANQIEFIQNHFSLLRAIIGDSGDGVPGIKSFGWKTIFKNMELIQSVLLPRDIYNETIKKMDFFKFDFKRENSIFDLEKMNGLEKLSPTMKKLFNEDAIKRVCMNIALMDYEVMMPRRKQKDNDVIESVLNFKDKFKTNEDIKSFIDGTKLWHMCPEFKISISL